MAQITICKKDWVIPEPGSECAQWQVYFNQLKSEYGSENARMIWLITWNANGKISCTTDKSFIDWLQKNNIDVSNASTRALADVSKIGSNILGLGKNLTNLLRYAVPATLGFVLLIILYFLYKVAKDASVEDIAALHPAGRAMKMSKAIGK